MVQGVNPVNELSNTDIFFQFISEQGGVSRTGKINVAQNGWANYISEFRSNPDEIFSYDETDSTGFIRYVNYTGKITTPINIPDTLAVNLGDINNYLPEALVNYKALQIQSAGTGALTIELSVEHIEVFAQILSTSAFGVRGTQVIIYFDLYKNGVRMPSIYSAGINVTGDSGTFKSEIFENIKVLKHISISAGDSVALVVTLIGKRLGNNRLRGIVKVKNINWKFYLTEQI